MASLIRNPMLDAQPFEENQGTAARASHHEMEAFYEDMKRQDLERKLSKRSTGSRWTRRKSVRKNAAVSAPTKDDPDSKSMAGGRSVKSESRPAPTIRSTSTSTSKRDGDPTADRSEENDTVQPLSPRSLVPGTLPKLATELHLEKEDWNSPASFRIKYPIHNPVGPRVYRNIHLARPSVRPSSFFSPAFPPMSYAHEASQNSSHLAGPSRASSSSLLPTPNSSQTGIVDPASGPGKRSRKNSQTDNVDLLDVTDPWGQNWHHTSPYDLGYSNNNSPTSPEPPEDGGAPHRPRRQSTITPQKPRMAPSPLSQSTSAIHLQTPDPHLKPGSSFKVLRKLSKRRNPVDDATFNPPRPGTSDQHMDSGSVMTHGNSQSGHMQSPSTLTLSTTRKEKRGSILGRLVKKFSILGKRSSAPVQTNTETWHHVDPPEPSIGRPSYAQDEPEPVEPAPIEPPKCPIEPEPEPAPVLQAESPVAQVDHDRRSSISVELTYSSGPQLTIANPDAPSVHSTPAAREAYLPSIASFPEDLPLPLVNPEPVLDQRSAQPEPSIRSSVRLSSPVPQPTALMSRPQSPPPQVVPPPPVPRKNPDRSARQPESEANRSSRTMEALQRPSHRDSEARSSQTVEAIPRPSHRDSEVRSSRTVEAIPRPSHRGSEARSSGALDDIHRPSHRDSEARSSRTLEAIPRPRESEARSSRHSVTTSMIASPAFTHSTVTESPLSVSSLTVNPPTPHAPAVAVAPTPGPPVPSKLPPKSTPSIKVVDARSRDTETYKLVRSKSGNMYHMNETIPGGGDQHWEIQRAAQVSPTKHHSSQSQPSAPAQSSRSGKERESDHGHRPRGSREKHEKHDQRREERAKSPTLQKDRRDGKERESSSGNSRGQRSSQGSHEVLRKPAPLIPPPKPEKNGIDRSKPTQSSPQKASSHHAVDLARNAPSDARLAQGATVQRRPSKANRPVSELPSAADLNSTKAKEAYEIERIWKARSMNGLEPHAVVFPDFHTGKTDIRYSQPQPPSVKAVHGSSHTSYTVQTPFQNPVPGSHIYHSMPTSPPPIIYSSSPSSSIIHTGSAVSPPSSQRDSQVTAHYSPSEIPPPSPFPALSSNPLPPPPKESPYRPKPIPGHDSSTKGLGQWTSYTGLTTAH